MKRENIIGNMWIPDNFSNPWKEIGWRHGQHDSDWDTVPNWDDDDPLNVRPNTFGLRKRR